MEGLERELGLNLPSEGSDDHLRLEVDLWRFRVQDCVMRIQHQRANWFQIRHRRFRRHTGTKRQKILLRQQQAAVQGLKDSIALYNGIWSKMPLRAQHSVTGPRALTQEQLLSKHSNPFASAWVSSTTGVRAALDLQERIKRDKEALSAISEDKISLCRYYAEESIRILAAMDTLADDDEAFTSGAIARLRKLYDEALSARRSCMTLFKLLPNQVSNPSPDSNSGQID
jgi:hypothetical protein